MKTPTLVWLKQFGTAAWDEATGITTDHSGNILICGYTEGTLEAGQSHGGSDAFLAKFDTEGGKIWLRQIGTSSDDYATGIAVDQYGNAFICGYTSGILQDGQSHSGADAFLAKFDTAGKQVWLKQIGTNADDYANGVATDHMGNIFISGYTGGDLGHGPTHGRYDAFLARYDTEGNQVWLKQIGTTSGDRANAIATDQKGNVFISGATEGVLEEGHAHGGGDAFLAKFNVDGTLIWLKQFGTPSFDSAKALATDPMGNIFICGSTFGEFEEGKLKGDLDTFLAKYDTNGKQIWIKQIGAAIRRVEAYSIAVDQGSNAFICGVTSGASAEGKFQGGSHAFLAKYDAEGSQLGLSHIGVASVDCATAITADHSGNVFLSGSLEGNSQSGAVFLAKYMDETLVES